MLIVQRIEPCKNPKYPQLRTRYKVLTLRTHPDTEEELKDIIRDRCGHGDYVVIKQDSYTGRLDMKNPVWKGRVSWL